MEGETTKRSDPGLHILKPDGQQETYLVLSGEERQKGFVRPVRFTYMHIACGGKTTINSRAIAETYARNPAFYTGTFCVQCRAHFPLKDAAGIPAFLWHDQSYVGE